MEKLEGFRKKSKEKHIKAKGGLVEFRETKTSFL